MFISGFTDEGRCRGDDRIERGRVTQETNTCCTEIDKEGKHIKYTTYIFSVLYILWYLKLESRFFQALSCNYKV